MTTHLIHLTSPPDSPAAARLIKRIKEEYPTCLPLSGSGILVESQEVADQIAERIGLTGEHQEDAVTGVIFKTNGTYSGYASRSLWDWLERAERAK